MLNLKDNIYIMEHLLNFNQLLEKLELVTTNWIIVSNEGDLDKEENNGYLIFNNNGIFSIIYKKNKEESRLDFYNSKEDSTDKKSICDCRIISSSGKDSIYKGFQDINTGNFWDILISFLDYSDVEKLEKNKIDKFLMGFTKSIMEVEKGDERDQLPSSFKLFVKILKDWASKKSNKVNLDPEDYEFTNIINKFLDHVRSLK